MTVETLHSQRRQASDGQLIQSVVFIHSQRIVLGATFDDWDGAVYMVVAVTA